MKCFNLFSILAALTFVSPAQSQETGLVGWWTFSADRQQGSSIKAWVGPNITPSGSYRFAAEPAPGRIELPGRDERLVVAESVGKADLPKQNLTVESWVRVDQAQEWGGIFSAIQDNGDFERGLLLGFRNDHFAFGVATEAGKRLTYLTADVVFEPGHWYYVAGTYDGTTQRLYVNGLLDGESSAQSGPVWYAPSGSVVAGAYQDDDEVYRMKGALEEIRIFDRALPSQEIAARYARRRMDFPAPAPEPVRLALPYGPFIDWVIATPRW
jgi:hypothetical protein